MARQFIYHMHGLTKAYSGGRKVLENINLSFYPDAKIGVLGLNGSGKSSVIDAITYALFGEHTRRSAKNLVRRGARQGSVQLQFSINSREYVATRVVGGNDARSQLTMVADGGKQVNRPIAGGERKQFGESMSSEVAKVLGLDYDRMCVAAVVQQGELLRIVDYSPKDFKELLNGLIGIQKLDAAYATMKDVVAGFRERLRGEIGYTDEEIPKLEKLVAEVVADERAALLAFQRYNFEQVAVLPGIVKDQTGTHRDLVVMILNVATAYLPDWLYF